MPSAAVLIVDDNPATLKLVAFVLSSRGYDVHTAGDAEQAMATLLRHRIDLALVDVDQPGIGGLELTRRIRAEPRTAKLVVLALALGGAGADADRAARAAGCNATLSRPIDTRALPGIVARHLASGTRPPVDPLPPDGNAAPARASVLVIDDDPLVSKSLRRALAHDYEVSLCGSGEEALAMLRAGRTWSVILCDLQMPRMSGIELHAVLAREQPGVLERIVFLTGGATSEEAREFLASVANTAVEKPFDLDHLREVIAAQARRR